MFNLNIVRPQGCLRLRYVVSVCNANLAFLPAYIVKSGSVTSYFGHVIHNLVVSHI